MSDKYCNFVRPSSPSAEEPEHTHSLNGEQAKRLYLEEVKDVIAPETTTHDLREETKTNVIHKIDYRLRYNAPQLADKDLFLSAQNNDCDTLIRILDNSPDKINIVDGYGWSLLMIACQANSKEIVKELLKRDIDTLIRDKAGNSARSLVIKSKNLALVDMFLSYKSKTFTEVRNSKDHKRVKRKKEYTCEMCNKTYPDEKEHLSSTVHNINSSRGRKIPTNYVIPTSNRGYQIMLRGGWDKETGLGPDGLGNKYPLRPTQKKDRKGLGHEKVKKSKKVEEKPVQQNKKVLIRDYHNSRKMEINFRRQFY